MTGSQFHTEEFQSAYKRSGKLIIIHMRAALKLHCASCWSLHPLNQMVSYCAVLQNLGKAFLVDLFAQYARYVCILAINWCFRSFHDFCLASWSKIQRLVGHRRVILQESDFQYQFLMKWQLFSHHDDCWVCFPPCIMSDRLFCYTLFVDFFGRRQRC